MYTTVLSIVILSLLSIGYSSFTPSCSVTNHHVPSSPKSNEIVLGIEQIDLIVSKLQDKRVALLVNQTSMIGSIRLVDTLQSLGVNIKKMLCPEHGCGGTAGAGEYVSNTIDSKTKLPIISLYGDKKKPTSDQLKDVDILVFDIQDVGVRFYTYISTLQYAMEACAENGKKVLVLDRPNPNGGYIDGPILEPAFASFVGLNPLPIVHGMTLGELAHMINGEGWLKDEIKCSLEVISMQNYTHHTPYTLPIPPSPNLTSQHAIMWYPSIGLFEGTVLSVGRGTPSPFEVIGHPHLPSDLGFRFTPVSIAHAAKKPPHKNKVCYGLDLRNITPKSELTLKYLIHLFALYPDKDHFFNTFFDKLAGTSRLREQIIEGMREQDIKTSWQDGLEAFKKIRARYLLYPD